MKKILLSTICCIILSGCAKTFYSENVSMLDFRKYAKEGFIINPTASGINSKPLSMINASFTSGTSIESALKGKDGIIEEVDKYTKTVVGYRATPERMMDKIVEECKKIGADGIVNFDVKRVRTDKYNNGYWEVSGIAIKQVK